MHELFRTKRKITDTERCNKKSRLAKQQPNNKHTTIGNVSNDCLDVALPGITNEGNTCYLNSLLQAILPLHKYADHLKHTIQTLAYTDPQSTRISSEVLSTLEKLQKNITVSTSNIRKALSKDYPDYNILSQKDVTETFMHFTANNPMESSPFKHTYQKMITCTTCKSIVNTETITNNILPLPLTHSIQHSS